MRSCAIRRVVVPTLPVCGRRAVFLALPPRFIILRGCDVGVDRVVLDHVVGILVGFLVGAGHHAKVAGFRVDGTQLAVIVEMQPCDIVAQRPDFPARQ